MHDKHEFELLGKQSNINIIVFSKELKLEGNIIVFSKELESEGIIIVFSKEFELGALLTSDVACDP